VKIRRSARTILATLLVLSVFILLTVWHNRAPGQLTEPEKKTLVKQLSFKNPKLLLFMKAMKNWDKTQGFYVMGAPRQPSWPVKLSRASYSDPLAAWSMASSLKIPTSGKLELVRYRSVEDFLTTLNETEEQNPGTLITLNFRLDQAIQEPPIVLSLRLLFFIVVGVAGLIVVKSYDR